MARIPGATRMSAPWRLPSCGVAAYNAQGYNPPHGQRPCPVPSLTYSTAWCPAGRPGRQGCPARSPALPDAAFPSPMLRRSICPAFRQESCWAAALPREEVRICGASATKGPATLTVCYDGRGQSSPADVTGWRRRHGRRNAGGADESDGFGDQIPVEYMSCGPGTERQFRLCRRIRPA